MASPADTHVARRRRRGAAPAAEDFAIPAAAAGDPMDFVILSRMAWDAEDARVCAQLLAPSDFPSTPGQRLFALIAARVEHGEATDPVSLHAAVKAELPDLVEAFSDLVASDHTARAAGVPIEADVRTFRQWSHAERFRDVVLVASRAVQEGLPAREVKRRLLADIDALESGAPDGRSYDDPAQQFEEIVRHLSSDHRDALPTGFRQLDRVFLPAQPGNLVLIGGRSGTGKSTAVRNFIHRWLTRYGARVAWLSFEMTALEQRLGLSCIDLNFDVDRALLAAAEGDLALTIEERDRLLASAEQWRDEPGLVINDRGGVTPDAVLALLRRYASQGSRVFVLDHLHRVNYGPPGKTDMRLELATFARQLKDFAKAYGVIVYALVQFTKGSKHEVPDDGMVREASNIVEECDKALYTFKPLVACERRYDGTLVPVVEGAGDRRIFYDDVPGGEPPKGLVWGEDAERVWFKLGKQRIRYRDALAFVRFRERSAALYDLDDLNPMPLVTR